MRDEDFNAGDLPADGTDAVGIVVRGSFPAAHPHLAFSWGPEVHPAPSLPFRRLKALEPKAA